MPYLLWSGGDGGARGGCAHVACADCLSRWRVTKDVCPVCEGPVYGVVLDAQLDFENAQRRGLQSF